MLGKLLYWSTQATLALTAVTLAAALLGAPAAVGVPLLQAWALATSATVLAGFVWLMDRTIDRAVAKVLQER